MKQIYLFEPQLIGRHIRQCCEIVEVNDKRAQNILKNGKGEEFTGDVDLHYKNLLKHSGFAEIDIDDVLREMEQKEVQREEYETAVLEVQEYEKAVTPKPKRKRKKKVE